ncbi:peptidylprolyl isomerase [Candidatus Poribacteria bacterium]|nr:peptidylprolyl isomerase [Candidatus Poribacteria bacterium]
MLKTLRYHMKKVIWVLVFAFVVGTILLFGMDSSMRKDNAPDAAAIINGERIPVSQYYNVYNRYAEFYQQFYNNNSNMAKNLFPIEEMAINQLIRDAVMVQKAKEMGIIVRDEEIIEKVKSYPVFQTDGKFDPQKWNSVVKTSRVDWISIEENTRKDLYVEKLERIVKDNINVSTEEVYDFYVQKNEKINLAYAVYDPASLVAFDSAKRYYDEHKTEFIEQRQYKARHILIKAGSQDKKASEEEKKIAKEKADKLHKQIKEGANFLKLALENSDDTGSKTQGGDLGYFSKGSMVKEFEEAVMKLKVGEVSNPVLSQFGYHIIKLEDIKEEHTKSFQEVEKQARIKCVTNKEKELAKSKASEFAAKAKTLDLQKEAKKIGLEYNTTGGFTRNASIPGVGYDKKVSSDLFKLKLDEITQPLEVTNKIYVFKLIAKPAIDSKKYEEDFENLKNTYKEEKQNKVMADYFEQLKSKAKIEVLIKTEKKSKTS